MILYNWHTPQVGFYSSWKRSPNVETFLTDNGISSGYLLKKYGFKSVNYRLYYYKQVINVSNISDSETRSVKCISIPTINCKPRLTKKKTTRIAFNLISGNVACKGLKKENFVMNYYHWSTAFRHFRKSCCAKSVVASKKNLWTIEYMFTKTNK